MAEFKNELYRTHDLPKYEPTLEEYDPGLTKKQWRDFIDKIEYPHHKGVMGVLKRMLARGGEATVSELSFLYGGTAGVCTGSFSNLSIRVAKEYGIRQYGSQYYAIPFVRRKVLEGDKWVNSYKLRPELKAALIETDLSRIPLYYRGDGIFEQEPDEDNQMVFVSDDDLVASMSGEINISEDNNVIDYNLGPQRRPDIITVGTHSGYIRSKIISMRALERAEYQCEIDKSHPSFIRRHTNIL